jgi:hypothetical protein
MVRVVVSLDEGTTVEVQKLATQPVFGGVSAGELVQQACVQVLTALGLTVTKGDEDGAAGRSEGDSSRRIDTDLRGG